MTSIPSENIETNTTKNSDDIENANSQIKNLSVVSSTSKVKVYRPSRAVVKGVPAEIEKDPILLNLINNLPSNYNFEIPKTVWRIKQINAKVIALQLPEGLQLFAEAISDIFHLYCNVLVINMGDVTYGACCVDDLSAARLGADLLIHYGHSCLVPIDHTTIPVMYVFVDIQFDSVHLIESLKAVFSKDTPLALVSIVQFVGSLQKLAITLKEEGYTVLVPQSRPLSPGEVLGCTSPPLPSTPKYTIIALGDGRFHLESIMISNPELDTYLYNPYNKVLSREYYDQPLMKKTRRAAIDRASKADTWGILFSTLGRQGSHKVRQNIQKQLTAAGKRVVPVDHDQLYPDLINSMSGVVQAWVQIACPRISIDWGQFFEAPLLTPYEAMVALKQAEWHQEKYPMDFYANSSLGPWTPNHVPPCPCGQTRNSGCKGRRCPSLQQN